MGFNFFKWFATKSSTGTSGTFSQVSYDEFFGLYSDVYFRELALQSCINLSARALSKCEFKTFSRDKPIKGREYYLWNVQPNQNQSSSVFLNKLVDSLFRRNEALVIENGGLIYVADDWQVKPYALYDNVFTGVTVDDFTFARSFAMSDVMYFKLAANDAKLVIDGLYESYRKLITYGMKGYQKSRGEKGTLELDATASGNQTFQDTYDDLKNEGFRKFAEAENAMMPLYKGMKYTSLANKTYSADSTRDIRAMIDDITDFTARGYGIPAQLLNGSVQDVDSATDQFLTFHLDPLVDLLAEEINSKRYGYSGFSQGDYLKIDTSCVKHVDVIEKATNIDKLVGSGALCVNDIRALIGEPLINEPWAWQHFITKNYSIIADALAAMEGGETK